MLMLIKEYDYNSYANNVSKLDGMVKGLCDSEVDEAIVDFFSAVREKIGIQLDTCRNTSEYADWCRSTEALEIHSRARGISKNISKKSTRASQLVISCAEDAAFLVSTTCAYVYNED